MPQSVRRQDQDHPLFSSSPPPQIISRRFHVGRRPRPAAAAQATKNGSGTSSGTARLTAQIGIVARSQMERRARTITAPVIARVATAVTPRTNAFNCGFFAHHLYEGASSTTTDARAKIFRVLPPSLPQHLRRDSR